MMRPFNLAQAYAKKVILDGPLDNFRMGNRPLKDQQEIRGLALAAPPPNLQQGKSDWRGVQSPMASGSNQSHSLMEPSKKPLSNRICSASGLVSTWGSREGDLPRRGVGPLSIITTCPFSCASLPLSSS